MIDRRHFLQRAGLASAATLALPASAPASAQSAGARPAALPPKPSGPPTAVARDEDYWREVATQYVVTDRATNLEAGYFGMMATPVREAYHGYVDRVNRESSLFAREDFPALAEASRERAAVALGIAPGELVFSRNATEALQTLIGQ